MVVVATSLDASSERIINYLNEYAQISINALFFAAFEDNEQQYLSRAWMIDPDENQERAVSKGKKGPWNGATRSTVFKMHGMFNEKQEPSMEPTDQNSKTEDIQVADQHVGKIPKQLRALWLEGKLTSPGAAPGRDFDRSQASVIQVFKGV